ncbi:hypothetical protein Goklo_016911 [Gossypium klotzschianum]|uniref:Uncharacterized protein n=1 Tax=Gossypium klotzschianum TaxID=34286 RepID=A0A7J8UFT2_9ROSI|nr:hypothetical protein [Gossypium klotzschianum]
MVLHRELDFYLLSLRLMLKNPAMSYVYWRFYWTM